MVWKKFENLDIQCWEHVADHRFGTRQPYLCLKAHPAAVAVFLEALDELIVQHPAGQLTLMLASFSRPRNCLRIRLVISPASDELTEMSLTRRDQTAEFELTPAGIKTFRDAVVAWQNGREDFSVGPSENSHGKRDQNSGEIWFWSSMDP